LHQTIKLTQEGCLREHMASHLLKGFSVQQCFSTNTPRHHTPCL